MSHVTYKSDMRRGNSVDSTQSARKSLQHSATQMNETHM